MVIVQKPTARSYFSKRRVLSTPADNLKDQFMHLHLVERKKMTKWSLKLFKRLLNSTVHSSFVVYRQMTGRKIQQLSYRIQLVDGLFTKCGYAECTGAGDIQHHSSTAD
jgi:hypothetical protein